MPTSWGKTQAEYCARLTWFESAAQRLGVPLPANPDDLSGPWGHFVQGLNHYLVKEYATALADAEAAMSGTPVAGFLGLPNHARILRDACRRAIGKPNRKRLAYRVVLQVDLPSLPANVDFTDAPWKFYGEAVQAARLHDAYHGQLLVYKGLKAAEQVVGHSAIWFLKSLGKSMTVVRKQGLRFPDGFDPHNADDVGLAFREMGVMVPSAAALDSPAWISLAQAFVALDRQAWQVCFRRIQSAWVLPGPEREHLEMLLNRLTKRIPVKRRMDSMTSPKRLPARPH